MIKNEYRLDEQGNVIVKGREGHDINYGELRTVITESGTTFVTAIGNFGYITEAFWYEALTLRPYKGEGNFNLTIQVGDRGLRGSVTLWPVDNKDVDYLCRVLTVDMGKRVTVESHARILATYDNGNVSKQRSLSEFYKDISHEMLEVTSWPVPILDYKFFEGLLSDCFRTVGDEDEDYLEYVWRDWNDRLVAVAHVDLSRPHVEEFFTFYYKNDLTDEERLAAIKHGRY